MVIQGLALVEKHNLNTVDATLPVSFNRYRASQAHRSPVTLVSADRRFLRAATVEGFGTLNPETVSADEVDALIASLA